MTVEEVKKEYGDVNTLCKILCNSCTANDGYCPTDCKSIAWVRRNYDKAIQKLAEYDGEEWTVLNKAKYWK